MLGHAAYLMGLALLAMLVAASDLSGSRGAIVVIGALGAWRYSWAALNFTRAVWFRRVAYPKRKARAMAAYKERNQPARAHFLVTSYRIPTDVSLRVYRSVFDAAMAAPGGAQVVASVVDAADARLVQTLFDLHCKGVKGVSLTIDRIPGTGKRVALAAGLTIGARLTAFAILARRLREAGVPESQLSEALTWLKSLAEAQMEFWENDAPARAKQGNLGAWAALAIWMIGAETKTPSLTRKAVQMHASVLCRAKSDGSLPVEMGRGSYALHYQLHALAPLVTLQAFLQQAETPRPCPEALKRAVDFALSDIGSGAQTQALTGRKQSYFTGADVLQPHELAWLEAYLTLDIAPDARSVAESLRPLYNSKLGGNQTKLWSY